MAYFDNIITRADLEEYYTKFELALSMTEDLNLLCVNLSEICSLLDDEKNISTYILTTMKLFAEDYLEEGHPYFFYALRSGPKKQLLNEYPQIYNHLVKLYAKYNTIFMCAERFVENPYDYVNIEYINGQKYIKIIRADREQLELDIDNMSLFRMANTILGMLTHLAKKEEYLPESNLNSLIKRIESLKKESEKQ